MTTTETKNNRKIAVVITAAGSSLRMGKKKEFLNIPETDETVLSSAVKEFVKLDNISAFVITIPKGEQKNAEKALFVSKRLKTTFNTKNPTKAKIPLYFVEGGETRQHSVLNALELLAQKENPDIVLIHDGARPFVTKEIIQNVLQSAIKKDAATCGITPIDTQKETNGSDIITRHLTREKMIAVQTPQGFKFGSLLYAHKKAINDGCSYTDDTEIWSAYNASPVQIVLGSPCNKKITFPQDLAPTNINPNVIKIGFGYDLHPLVKKRKLVIGGLDIPYHKGEAGHSDGDVLLHAITDAILGAANLGDIGEMFPPSDKKWKNADSKTLLSMAWQKVHSAGWNIGNIDCVIKLEQPKILPYRNKIIESISEVLETNSTNIFVKAKTSEKLDSVGKGKAIEAWASCLLVK